MTIDEAIAHAREVAKESKRISGVCASNDNECDKFSNCIRCAEEHEQLANWLEDYKRLKSIPEHTYENCHNYTCKRKSEKKGYNNALDDFVRMAKEIKYQDGSLSDVDLKYVAEQLKAGVKNE